MNSALSAVFLLLVLLLASRVLWRIGLVALFLSWPVLTIYIALLDTRPPGFARWVLFLLIALSVAIPGVLFRVWMRQRVSETACREPDAWTDGAGSQAAPTIAIASTAVASNPSRRFREPRISCPPRNASKERIGVPWPFLEQSRALSVQFLRRFRHAECIYTGKVARSRAKRDARR